MNHRVAFIIFIMGIVGAYGDTHENSISPNRDPTDREIKMSEEAGYSYVDRLAQLEEDLYAKGQYVREGSPFYHMAQFKKPQKEAQELGRKAAFMLEATRFLKEQLSLTNEESGMNLRQSSFSIINDTCLSTTTCATTSKYRTVDGSCNSLTTTNLGKSFTDYRRVTEPSYADGIQTIRLAASGDQLPSAREVSIIVFGDADKPITLVTLALMQFGQFINHDFQASTTFTFSNGTDISCCSSTGGTLSDSELHPACLPISVSEDDKFFNNSNRTKIKTVTTCMNFVRSIAGPRLDCSLGYADQLNQNTHWLDASTVYGSKSTTLDTLRTFTGGLLKTTRDTTNNRDLLPITSTCTTGSCFYAGDARVTEQPQLTVMHTIWMREHNRIAKLLSGYNPTWSDESIFQEARRIVIAEIQHITYNEFIPSLLSTDTITKYGLAPLTSGFFTNYTDVTSGPISNEFSTAAFRMGHSLVQGNVKLYDENDNLLPSSYTMSDTFNDASKIINDITYFDAVIRGLLTQPTQSVDQLVDESLWNKLFRATNRVFGFDVVALNIQRGRDHGLPSYNTYRQWCGFNKLTSFDDMSVNSTTNPFISTTMAGLIATVYTSVDDIDLFVGALTEKPTTGTIAGPTLNCLIGENFSKIKYSDRYFYELGGQPHSFSSTQLTEIRKTSLARIFCDNSDGTVLSVQPKAFAANTISGNAKVLCTDTASIQSLDLSLWKDEPLF